MDPRRDRLAGVLCALALAGCEPALPPADDCAPSAGDAVALDLVEPCTAIEAGALVQPMRVATAPPTPTGGALVDGTYRLIEATSYTGLRGPAGPSGAPLAVTVAIAGTRWDQVASEPGNYFVTARFVVARCRDATLAFTPICGPIDARALRYTVSGARLMLFLAPESVLTFAR